MRYPEPIHLITSLYPLTNISPSSHSLAFGNHQFILFYYELDFCFFRFHIYVNHVVFVLLCLAYNTYHVGDLGSIPGSGRSPGEENGNPRQYSCLEKFTDRGAWGAIVHGVAKSRT